MTNSFIHFRAQSSYSMLEGAIKIPALIALAKQHEMPALALTDRGNLFAALEFALEAKKHQIHPVHGCILKILFPHPKKEYFLADILLLAKDDAGYKNLLHLVSNSFIVSAPELGHYITLEDLQAHNEGLIMLSAYLDGVVGQLLLDNHPYEAKQAAELFKDIFGNRLYFEIMRAVYPRKQERAIEPLYLKLAQELQLPLLATNQVLFSEVNMHDAHDILLCIAQGVKQAEQQRKRVSNQCYFKTAKEMQMLFADLPEAIENTVHLMQRCYVMAQAKEPSLPSFAQDGISEADLLQTQATQGLKIRLDNIPIQNEQEYWDRLSYELDIICKMNFAGYFLIVADFINWSKKNNIMVGPGRGSGAGSIIAWALGITDLDPIKFGLLFERFLNPERISMPDFDIDFCQERREEVISYVRTKYGQDRVAQIITFGKLQAKAVVKDVARVLDIPFIYANYITDLIPFNAVNPVTLRQAIEEVPELKHAYEGKGLYQETLQAIKSREKGAKIQKNVTPQNTSAPTENSQDNNGPNSQLLEELLRTALVLEGLHRHASVHAAGIVISDDSLMNNIALYQDTSSSSHKAAANNQDIAGKHMGLFTIQYSMKYAELSGLVKFDFLGLQTLTLISRTLDLIRKRGIELDINKIAYDDAKTYEMLATGLSNGVFQFESVGMKSALRRLVPDSLDDLVALGALYRPGPMDNIPTYIACKHGTQEPDYLHPLLEPILKATYGVIIYQEQVMEIARVLAGYSLGGADLLRRAMGKKVKAEMDAQEELFVQGAVNNNVDIEQARSIFATVAKFAGYGFNKSHASAYAVISYQTAYLKAHYLVEFLTAFLNLEISDSDKVSLFVQEARSFNVKIMPPDINRSQGYFTITYDELMPGGMAIEFALGAIKNVTPKFGQIVAENRQKFGPFKSVMDFAARMEPKLLNKRVLENLIHAGCFDSLHPNRHSLYESISLIMQYNFNKHDKRHLAQLSLLGDDAPQLKDAQEYTCWQMAREEFAALGLFMSVHPLQNMQSMLQQREVKSSRYIINEMPDGHHNGISIAGVIVKKDSRMSQRGMFVTLVLSDLEGALEVTIYNADLLRDAASFLAIQSMVLIMADVHKDKGGIRISALHIIDIEEGQKYRTGMIYLRNNAVLAQLLPLLAEMASKDDEHPENQKADIYLYINTINGFKAKIALGQKILLNDNMVNKLRTLSDCTIEVL